MRGSAPGLFEQADQIVGMLSSIARMPSIMRRVVGMDAFLSDIRR